MESYCAAKCSNSECSQNLINCFEENIETVDYSAICLGYAPITCQVEEECSACT